MKKRLLLLGVSVTVGLCLASTVQAVFSKPESADQAIPTTLQMQADAWNRGDLNTFMTGYLNSPDTSYVSSDAQVWGYKALHDRYQKRYGESPDTMGKLSFSDLKIFDLGSNHALCVGRWHLERAGKPPAGGIYSLVFVRTKDGWKIMHDHTSATEPSAS